MDNKLKIINYLGKHLNESYTMYELSKLTKIPYTTLHRLINKIKNLVIIKQVGNSKTVALNKKAKPYLIISSLEEKEEFIDKNKIIKKIVNEIEVKDIILLFGSYAKQTQTEKSDIDLLIINKDGSKTISFSKYELLFTMKINPIFVTKSEYRQMLKESQENVGKQALKNHILLNNPEDFWEETLNAI